MSDIQATPLKTSFTRRTFTSLAIIVLFTVALRAPLLNIPFDGDEGEYSYIAWRMGYHELPYRDWIDQKPPAIFWVYRLALSLPLDPIRSVHLMAMLFSGGSACALFFVARRFVSPPWPEATALLFALLSSHPLIQGTEANTEIFMLLPLILSQVTFFSATENGKFRTLFMLLTGVLTGIAMAFKQVAGVNWPFLIALYPVFVSREGRLRQTLSFAAWSTAGMAAVWGLILFYFFIEHAARDFIYWVLTHNLEYVHGLPWSDRLMLCSFTVRSLFLLQCIVWAFAGAGFWKLWLTGSRQASLYMGGWLMASLIGVSASGYFFHHYFQQILPVLAVAAVLGAKSAFHARFWSFLSAPNRGALLGILLVLLPAIALFPFLFSYSPAEAMRNVYPMPRGGIQASAPEIGSRISQLTSPQDRVFLWGAEPEILFHAKRVSATRYIILFPLYGSYSDARERQMAVAMEISNSIPAVVVGIPDGLLVDQSFLSFYRRSERFLTSWTSAYVDQYFHADSWLSTDYSGVVHVVPAGDFQGQKLLGAIFVRNASSGSGLGTQQSSETSTNGDRLDIRAAPR